MENFDTFVRNLTDMRDPSEFEQESSDNFWDVFKTWSDDSIWDTIVSPYDTETTDYLDQIDTQDAHNSIPTLLPPETQPILQTGGFPANEYPASQLTDIPNLSVPPLPPIPTSLYESPTTSDPDRRFGSEQ